MRSSTAGIRRRKRLPLLPLILSLGLLATSSCGPEGPDSSRSAADESSDIAGGQVLIGFSQYTLGAPYFVELVNSAKRAAEAKGHRIFVVDAQDSMNKQLADVEDLLAKDIDLLLLNAKDPVGGIPAARAAAEATKIAGC